MEFDKSRRLQGFQRRDRVVVIPDALQHRHCDVPNVPAVVSCSEVNQ